MSALPTVADLAHGDHVCAFFDTAAQRRRVVTDFVRDGLDQGDRVWYLTDTVGPETVLAELTDDGVDVDAALASGQFAVLSTAESYLRELPFDPDRMATTLTSAIDDALADGYAGFRVSGDLTWATQDVHGADRVLAYESRLNQMFADRPAAAVCQYDLRAFDSTTLSATVGLHTHQLADPPGATPLLSIAALPDGSGLRIEGDADLATRSQFRSALDRLRAEETHLFLGGLRFLDVCCLDDLLMLARPPRRLVLHEPPRVLLRMLDALQLRDRVEVLGP